MRRAKVFDLEIAWDEVGAGDPAFVVVPQWYLSSRSMRASALVRKLAERHRVILYDRRGTGESDRPGPPYSTARDSRDLGGLVDAVGLDGSVALGMGVRGSQVALHFAGHFPQKVRAVVCVGGTPRWGAGPEWPYGIGEEAWLRAFGDLEGRTDEEPPPGASLALEADWRACGHAAALDILERTRTEDLRNFLPKITPPALVIHLAGDRLVPFEAARWLAESLPHGTLEVFQAPRTVPFTAPEELASHIEEFLATAG